jgi:hypothetical protein
VHEHHDGVPLASSLERGAQRTAVRIPADDHLPQFVRRRRGGNGRGFVHMESAQHLCAIRAPFGIRPQQCGAKRFEILRHVGRDLGQARRRFSLLGDKDVETRAVERQAPRNRLEEHHADAVPVARDRHRLPLRLFRGHVGRRPSRTEDGALVCAVAPQCG